MRSIKKEIVFVALCEFALWAIWSLVYLIMSNLYPEQFHLRLPAMIWLNALFIAIFILYFYLRIEWEKHKEKWNATVLSSFFQRSENQKPITNLMLFRIGAFCLILALAQPLFGVKKVKAMAKDIEIVLAVDVSNSMDSRDISSEFSRLQIVKRAIIQLLNQCQGERIGIVLFAQNAFVQLPLTKDYSAVKLFVNEFETKMLSNQGTNLQAALDLADEVFTDRKNTKAILLFTDGENHEDIPVKVLANIKKKEYFLGAIGVGTDEGGPVPVDADRPELGYISNEKGDIIKSRMNYKLIRRIAQESGGSAVAVQTAFPNLSELLTQINRESKGKMRDLDFEIKSNKYHYPLLIGMLVWFLSWNPNLFWSRKGK